MNIAKFLKTPILHNIERLLLVVSPNKIRSTTFFWLTISMFHVFCQCFRTASGHNFIWFAISFAIQFLPHLYKNEMQWGPIPAHLKNYFLYMKTDL